MGLLIKSNERRGISRGMKKEFENFKKHFRRYQEKFGLGCYNVFFKHEAINEDVFANISVNTNGMTATVKLNKKLDKNHQPFNNIKKHAKHEAIHLLLDKIEDLARRRYVIDEDIYSEIEGLTNNLMELIPD